MWARFDDSSTANIFHWIYFNFFDRKTFNLLQNFTQFKERFKVLLRNRIVRGNARRKCWLKLETNDFCTVSIRKYYYSVLHVLIDFGAFTFYLGFCI